VAVILITGGGGFIGSALARALTPHYDVRVFDNFYRGLSHPPDPGHPGAFDTARSILDREAIADAMVGVDIVIHAAAIAGVSTVVSQPFRVLQVNLLGTANVIEAAHNAGVKRLILFSTSEVYGPLAFWASENNHTTQGPLTEPRWVYSVSKLASEYLCAGYGREYDIPYTILRPFNVYGPGQLGEGAINNFVRRAIYDEPLIVHGEGLQLRAWCYIDDCVQATVAALTNPRAENEVLNIGNPGATCTTVELAQRIIDLAHSKSVMQFVPLTYPEINVRMPDISKAQRLLGFEPLVGLTEGLLQTIADAWARQYA